MFVFVFVYPYLYPYRFLRDVLRVLKSDLVQSDVVQSDVVLRSVKCFECRDDVLLIGE